MFTYPKIIIIIKIWLSAPPTGIISLLEQDLVGVSLAPVARSAAFYGVSFFLSLRA